MLLTLIVDASVALRWIVIEPDSGAADLVPSERGPLTAPDLIVAEIANIVWRLQRLPRLVPLPLMHERALEIAVDRDQPVHDCCYVALAEGEGARLLTADRGLLRRVSGSAYARLVKPQTP